VVTSPGSFHPCFHPSDVSSSTSMSTFAIIFSNTLETYQSRTGEDPPSYLDSMRNYENPTPNEFRDLIQAHFRNLSTQGDSLSINRLVTPYLFFSYTSTLTVTLWIPFANVVFVVPPDVRIFFTFSNLFLVMGLLPLLDTPDALHASQRTKTITRLCASIDASTASLRDSTRSHPPVRGLKC
jgi:hypothetical protein